MWLMKIIDDQIANAADKERHMLAIVEGRVKTSWLMAFDANAAGGRGVIRKTNDPEKAKKFATFEDVMACWKTQSRVKPLRNDGEPNRPLTAYSIEPVDLDKPLPS